MNRFLFIPIILAITACGSSHTLYQGNVKLTQDGDNCIIEKEHEGDFKDKAFNQSSRVVHKDSACTDFIKCKKKACSAPETAIKEEPVNPAMYGKVPNEIVIAENSSSLDKAIAEMQARNNAQKSAPAAPTGKTCARRSRSAAPFISQPQIIMVNSHNTSLANSNNRSAAANQHFGK